MKIKLNQILLAPKQPQGAGDEQPKTAVKPDVDTEKTPETVDLAVENAELRKQLDETKGRLKSLTASGVTPEMEATVAECLRAGHTREDAIIIARREQLGKEARKIKDPEERELAIRAAASAM